MNVKQLINELPCLIKVHGDENTQVLSLSADSRKIEPGALFFCIHGIKVDAHEFAPQAVAAGASVLVVERELDVDATQIVVTDVRLAMSYIAQSFFMAVRARSHEDDRHNWHQGQVHHLLSD